MSSHLKDDSSVLAGRGQGRALLQPLMTHSLSSVPRDATVQQSNGSDGLALISAVLSGLDEADGFPQISIFMTGATIRNLSLQ